MSILTYYLAVPQYRQSWEVPSYHADVIQRLGFVSLSDLQQIRGCSFYVESVEFHLSDIVHNMFIQLVCSGLCLVHHIILSSPVSCLMQHRPARHCQYQACPSVNKCQPDVPSGTSTDHQRIGATECGEILLFVKRNFDGKRHLECHGGSECLMTDF